MLDAVNEQVTPFFTLLNSIPNGTLSTSSSDSSFECLPVLSRFAAVGGWWGGVGNPALLTFCMQMPHAYGKKSNYGLLSTYVGDAFSLSLLVRERKVTTNTG